MSNVTPMRADSLAASINLRADGMMAVLNRVTQDRNRFDGGGPGNMYMPDVVYGTDGIASIIVDRPAEDAVSGGWCIEGDDNEDIRNELDRLDAGPVLTTALRWTRLHGGGAVLMFLDDGLPLTEPLDLTRIRLVEDLLPYSASAITPTEVRYNDPTKRNYGWPALYDLRPQYGTSFPVHESRLIFMPGDPLPPTVISQQSLPWIGRSALDACWTDLCRYRSGLRLSQAILERKQQLVHKMSALGDQLAAGLDDIVAKRLGMADAVRGVFNMLAVDSLDDMILADSNLQGIGETINDYKVALCASSGIPMAILFGEKTSGLNANAEGELGIYHSRVRAMQERCLTPAIEKLAGVIWAQKALGRSEPQAWKVKFHPLFSPKATDLADIALKNAQARKNAMDAVVAMQSTLAFTPEEIRAAAAQSWPELDLPEGVAAMPDDDIESDTTVSRALANPGTAPTTRPVAGSVPIVTPIV